MDALRRLTLAHRGVAALLLAAALALRLLVPAGFMPDVAGGAVRLVLCPAADPLPVMATPMPGPMAGMTHHQGPRDHQAPSDAPCAYAGLSLAPVLPVDPLVLAAAMLVAMAIALERAAFAMPARAAFLRPPLRGPPATA